MVDETAAVVEEVADEDSVEAARDASESQPEDFFAGEVDNTETKKKHTSSSLRRKNG